MGILVKVEPTVQSTELRTFPKRHFKIEEQDVFINFHGITVYWYKASLCPCVEYQATGQPNIECPYCYGNTGVYYDNDYTEIKILVAGRELQKIMEDPGLAEIGKAHCTIKSTDFISDDDKFVFINEHRIVNNETFIKDAIHSGGATKEVLRHRFPTAVESLVSLTAVDGDIVKYEYERDFKLVEDFRGYIRQIHWLTPVPPETGASYSVRYRAKPEYVFRYEYPKLRYEGDRRLASAGSIYPIDRFRGFDA